MAVPSGEIATRLRVRYAETDAMGIVHHSQYAIWFEAGRSDFFRAAGLPYSACESQGAYFPVTEEFVRFSQSAVYDEEITICTRVAEVRSRGVTFRYEARNATQSLLATGYTRHVCVNANREVQIIPDWLRQVLTGGK